MTVLSLNVGRPIQCFLHRFLCEKRYEKVKVLTHCSRAGRVLEADPVNSYRRLNVSEFDEAPFECGMHLADDPREELDRPPQIKHAPRIDPGSIRGGSSQRGFLAMAPSTASVRTASALRRGARHFSIAATSTGSPSRRLLSGL